MPAIFLLLRRPLLDRLLHHPVEHRHRCHRNGGHVSIDEVIEGDTVREVLQYVQFSGDELLRSMRKTVEKALREQKLSLDESRVLLKFYESGLEGYTYLE